MPANAQGTCSACLTFDFECVCPEACAEASSAPTLRERRKRSPEAGPESQKRRRRLRQSSEESSTQETEGAHQDLLEAAQRASEQWKQFSAGVLWGSFQIANSPEAVLEEAKKIAVRADVLRFYVGVCKSPVQRFYEKPTATWVPHMERFHAMCMLSLGRHMGEFEKKLIRECRSVASQKCLNKSGGGEGIHRKSIRFCYVAVRFHTGAA